MKRLLRISFDLSLLSFIPILSWFLLGIIVDKSLINIFTLTYPLQFIYYIIKSIFSTGANISKEKDKNKDAVMSGLILGTIVSIIIFAVILLNVDNYIKFMNMDINTYKNFTIYSILQLFICLEFSMMQDKLYYEEKNKLANKYSLIFNLLNFVLLIGTSLITKNQTIIIGTTLIPLLLFTIYVYIKNSDKFKYNINVFKCIKYDSVELFNNIAFFLIFLFGLSNALEYGEVYATALTFIALITDTQWDTADAIVIASNIDISKNKFNYKIHRNNAYKLLSILFATSLLMFSALYWFYDLNFKITMIYFSFEIVNFLIYPIYRIKTCYLQLEYSALKTTSNKIIASILRMFMSLLKTPFCTGIGQVTSSIYQFITVNLMFHRNFVIDKEGKILEKERIIMKITKYPQSCLLVETKGKKILIDPGTIKYKEEYFDVWNNVDIILITHKHPDHCNTEILEKISNSIKIYSTKEVQDANQTLNINVIKENDIIELEGIKVEVVHALHGYQPLLKGEKEVNENVGYIIDDGENRLYTTSDTICFKNDYKADIICIPVTGYGLTMSAFEAALYSKEVGATLTIPIHMDNPAFPPDFKFIEEMFNKYDVEYEILENEECIEVE